MKRPLLQLDPCALLVHFSGTHIHLKHSEAQDCGSLGFKGHLRLPQILARV